MMPTLHTSHNHIYLIFTLHCRLQRCTAINTSSEDMISRCKPLKYTYEKEIVMYAYFKKLDYFSTECIYSPNAYRGHARAYIKDLEKIRPTTIIDIIHSGEQLVVGDKARARLPEQSLCKQCGYISSQEICKACVLLEGLNRGLPQLGVGKSSKHKKTLTQLREDQESQGVVIQPKIETVTDISYPENQRVN